MKKDSTPRQDRRDRSLTRSARLNAPDGPGGGSGLTGAAAITTALGSLGPGGMIGGVAALGVALLLVRGISEFGFDAILSNVVKQLYKQGETKETIKQKIEGYHVAKSLRFKLVGMLDSLPEEETASQALAVA